MNTALMIERLTELIREAQKNEKHFKRERMALTQMYFAGMADAYQHLIEELLQNQEARE